MIAVNFPSGLKFPSDGGSPGNCHRVVRPTRSPSSPPSQARPEGHIARFIIILKANANAAWFTLHDGGKGSNRRLAAWRLYLLLSA